METNSGFTMSLPVLVGKNYDRWQVQMKVLFGYQEVLEVVQNGVQLVEDDAPEVQQSTSRESKRKDCKALFMIHQCVDESNFEKISSAKTAKEAWENLEKCYAGAEKVKKVRLQILRREALTNQMKSCGEEIREQLIVEKVLRTLVSKFDHVVVAIEESKDLEQFKIDELQSSLEAHEQRIKERIQDRGEQRPQALQAYSYKRHSSQEISARKERAE
ncbi:PREDICTED: uncharacterized protein LOC109344747 [Lupinus angustifolius]|uniref:uncharacterized protein LOC109344747 n=1 Tax=Lupinus angustifolius TaxID=3871 RepID=UPI00092F9669|nr:PREDICTED: uncharacterized protein LOC109344747 [Lupinus angustifolius]